MIVTGLAFLTVATTSTLSLYSASMAMVSQEHDKLHAIQGLKSEALKSYLASIREDLSVLSKNQTVRQAVYDFQDAWYLLGAGQTEKLQKLYIQDNPNPPGKKEELDFAPDASEYSLKHAQYHPWFRHFLRERGYYDIFLFDVDGNIVYTVFKELDFATNVNRGQWKDTDIGEAFRKAKANPKGDAQFFFDFKPYAPSNNVPAAFISQPILNENGTLAGVIAFQMPIGRINAIMQSGTGLGEYGESYIVGSDFLMRSDSRFGDKGGKILETKIETDDVKKALAGETGIAHVFDYHGDRVYSAYSPIDFLGIRWANIAYSNQDEIWAPIYDLIYTAEIQIFLMMIVITIIGLLVARTISRPITQMVTAMNEIAQERYETVIPGVDRGDEIGAMAASVQVFKENGLEANRLRLEQEANEKRAIADKKRMMNELADSFDLQVGGSITQLSGAAEKLKSAAGNMQNTARQTQEASSSVASAS